MFTIIEKYILAKLKLCLCVISITLPSFSQGFLAKRLVERCGKNGKAFVIMACCVVLGVGRYIAYYTESLLVIYATFFFIINALGTLNTVVTADTGAIAPSNEVGALFGILEASQSAAGMIGPFVGGLISHYLGKDAPLIAVVGVYCLLFTFVSWGYELYVISCSNDGAKPEVKTSKGKDAKKLI
jgi:MFS family permease